MEILDQIREVIKSVLKSLSSRSASVSPISTPVSTSIPISTTPITVTTPIVVTTPPIPTKLQLSTHFTLDDLSVTEFRDLISYNRTIAVSVEPQLTLLCKNLLEPIWQKYGSIVVTSGFRCLSLNSRVGSTDASQHLLGQAADFKIAGATNHEQLVRIFQSIWKDSSLKWHQLINEGQGTWIHISLPTGQNDQQVMLYDIESKTYKKLA